MIPGDEKPSLGAFVARNQGTRVISRILIANNGIAAVKEMMSIRRWAMETFQDASVIRFIAMPTAEDVASNARYIQMADEHVLSPGGPNNMNFANVELIVNLAQLVKADAVWAGWGHASENPLLPDKLLAVGIKFIGPTSNAMRTLGDKISSMLVAEVAGVPTLPWSGSGLAFNHPSFCSFVSSSNPTPETSINSSNPDLHATNHLNSTESLDFKHVQNSQIIKEIPDDLYRSACINGDNVQEIALQIGFPLMAKASEGGGGKGIRIVSSSKELFGALDTVKREAPGSPIFLMRLAQEARHLEVQLLADEYGQVISIHGRDCSIQRRHQKIIEEAPVSVVNSTLAWRQIEQAAVRLARLVGYQSLGTVEFLYSICGFYYFNSLI